MTNISRRTAIAAIAAAPLVIATSAQAATHNVTIKGFSFSPATMTVKAGDTIVFTNQDGAPHTATARNKSFDTGRLNKGASASVTLAAAGQIEYFCKFHPNMSGSINVT